MLGLSIAGERYVEVTETVEDTPQKLLNAGALFVTDFDPAGCLQCSPILGSSLGVGICPSGFVAGDTVPPPAN